MWKYGLYRQFVKSFQQWTRRSCDGYKDILIMFFWFFLVQSFFYAHNYIIHNAVSCCPIYSFVYRRWQSRPLKVFRGCDLFQVTFRLASASPGLIHAPRPTSRQGPVGVCSCKPTPCQTGDEYRFNLLCRFCVWCHTPHFQHGCCESAHLAERATSLVFSSPEVLDLHPVGHGPQVHSRGLRRKVGALETLVLRDFGS